MNYTKRVDFDVNKNCFLVNKEDVYKLFQMYSDSLMKDDAPAEIESDANWNWMVDNIYPVRQEHRLTLEKVIDTLGMGNNFVNHFGDYRKKI